VIDVTAMAAAVAAMQQQVALLQRRIEVLESRHTQYGGKMPYPYPMQPQRRFGGWDVTC